jgi:chemotaxis protein MotB
MRRNNKSTGRGTGRDRYLLPYADLLTLLFGLFVLLYASSVTDLAKFGEYKEAFYQVFEPNGPVPNEGGEGLLDNKGNSLIDPLLPPTEKTLGEVEDNLRNTLSEYFDNDRLDLRMTEEGLVLSMNEKFLFSKGSADVESESENLLDTLSTVLVKIANPVEISGHTDSDPISTTRYPTNWHLASARASTVCGYLISRGVNPVNTKVVSYADQRPLESNETPEGKSANRRVEITIAEPDSNTPISENIAQ